MNRRFTRRGLLGTAGTLAVGTMTARAQDSDSSDNRPEWVEPSLFRGDNLFPLRAGRDGKFAYLDTVLDGPYAITPTNEFFPLWMDVSTADYRVFDCELRDGLEWGNGYGEMRAHDWVFQINEVLTTDSDVAGRPFITEWGDASAEITGERSFRIELPAPDSEFLFKRRVRELRCLPRELYEAYLPDIEALLSSSEVNTIAYGGNLGPYTFERWTDSEFVARRNEEYYLRNVDGIGERWERAPQFSSFTYRTMGAESDRLSAFANGELTTVDLTRERAKEFESSDAAAVYAIPSEQVDVVLYNQRASGWDQFRTTDVRRAFSAVVDSQAALERVAGDDGRPTRTLFPAWADPYDAATLYPAGIRDGATVERARGLLEAGTTSEYEYDGDTFTGPDGQVSLTLVAPNSRSGDVLGVLEGAYESLGVSVDVETYDFVELLNGFMENTYTGSGSPEWSSGNFNAGPPSETESQEPWDMVYGVGWIVDTRVPSQLEQIVTTRGSTNFAGHVPTRDLDQLFSEYRKASEAGEREDRLTEILEALNRDQPGTFIGSTPDLEAYDADIEGPEESFGHRWDDASWGHVEYSPLGSDSGSDGTTATGSEGDSGSDETATGSGNGGVTTAEPRTNTPPLTAEQLMGLGGAGILVGAAGVAKLLWGDSGGAGNADVVSADEASPGPDDSDVSETGNETAATSAASATSTASAGDPSESDPQGAADESLRSGTEDLHDGALESAIADLEGALEAYEGLESAAADERAQQALTAGAIAAGDRLRQARTAKRVRGELTDLLSNAEDAYREAVAGHVRGDITVVKLRYRQARDRFDEAADVVAEFASDGDVDALFGSTGIAVDPTTPDSPPDALTDVAGVTADVAEALAGVGVDSVADVIGAEDDRAAAFVDAVEDDDVAGRIEALSRWPESEASFADREAIVRRRERAVRGREWFLGSGTRPS